MDKQGATWWDLQRRVEMYNNRWDVQRKNLPMNDLFRWWLKWSGEGRTKWYWTQTRFGRGRPKFGGRKDWARSNANDDIRREPKSNFNVGFNDFDDINVNVASTKHERRLQLWCCFRRGHETIDEVGCHRRDCIFRMRTYWVYGFWEKRATTHNEEVDWTSTREWTRKEGRGLREQILEKKKGNINFTKIKK